MEFISLSNVLCKVAECIELPQRFDYKDGDIGAISPNAADTFWNKNEVYPGMLDFSVNEKIEWARKMSHAALKMNNALLGTPDASLQWAEFHGKQHIDVNSDSTKQEALAMLKHAIGWGNRREEKYNNHFRNSIGQGDAALALPVALSEDEELTLDGKMLRLMQIGCDRAKLIAFLDANGMVHSLEVHKAPASEPVTPFVELTLPSFETQVLRHQEAEQITTHKIRNRTPSILDAEISQAKKQALNSNDKSSVWAELVKMAENRIGCLLGVDGKDIRYQSGEKALFFKKRSLNERMNRAATH